MLETEEDFRVEVLVAFWLENGEKSVENIIIHPQGTFVRAYNKDVLQVNESDNSQDVVVTINISREGLYDMLPEGLFHQVQKKNQKSTRDSIEESKRYKKEEKAARKLFLPLEQEFYRQRIWLEHSELRACLNNVHPENVKLFFDFWGLKTDIFNTQQSNFMLSVMPYLHRVVGNMDLVNYCLELMMQEKIKIHLKSSSEQKVNDEELISRLGAVRLGVDSVLGEKWIDDEPALEVIVGPISLDKIHIYLNEGKAQRQLKTLYGFFFPAEADIITTILLDEGKINFKLSDTEDISILGYSTII
ncbi:type VI secretion system baseplate subunit TssG [soil metagenome]